MEIMNETIEEISAKLEAKEISAVELTKLSLAKIDRTKDLNILHEVCEEKALESAKEIDEKRANGENLPKLAGIPIVIKDNISKIDTFTTCSSQFLADYKSPYNATVVDKLIENGAIIIGKANMDEFAMGSSSENCAFGAVRNPWNRECVPGGSSGGSAASVASDQCFASLGTDTGGSIRQPSSFCGVVGLKPTYGLVSRFGVVAFASSLDQVGPITKSVRDSSIMLDAIAGHDDNEFTSEKRAKENYYADSFKGSVKGLKIGIAKEFFESLSNIEVKESIEKAIDFFVAQGAEKVEINLPHIKDALAVYYVLSSAEAASNLARFDGIKYGVPTDEYKDLVDFYVQSRTKGFGKEVKRRIMLGNFVLSSGYFDAYYNKAKAVQNIIINEFEKAFSACDIIISPTTPSPAFKIGEKVDNPLEMYLNDIYTVPVNIATLPAISIPCGISKSGLPLGMQLIGNRFNEKTLFNAGDCFEKNYFSIREVK